MAAQAAELAAKVTAANAALIDAVQGCSEADWRQHSEREGRSVAVLAYHVALAYGAITSAAQAAADGGQPTLPTSEELDGYNAHQAIEAANVSQAEVIELLQRHGVAAAALVGALSDPQLARTFIAFGGQEWSVAQFIEAAVVGHPQQHLASIREALGR